MFCGFFKNIQKSRTNKSLNNKICFKPPYPPQYLITTRESILSKRGPQNSKCSFFPNISYINFPWIEINCYQSKKPSTKNKIVIMHVKNKTIATQENKKTILYSHGSSVDLGTLYPKLIDIATVLKCDIVAYDYTGYGQSEGIFQEKELYTDIEEVIDFALVNLGISVSQITVFGDSIGTVPSFHIVSKPQYCGVNGMILLSPIASGNNLIQYVDEELDKEVDIFSTLHIIGEVICPVFIMHGKKDQVIPIEQSVMIAKKIKHIIKWYPNNGTHWNLFTLYRLKTFTKIKKFLSYLDENRNRLCLRNKVIEITYESEVDCNTYKKPVI